MKECLVPYCDQLKQEVKSKFCYICPKCGNTDKRKLHVRTKKFIGTIYDVYHKKPLTRKSYYTWKKHRTICLNCWHVWRSPAYPVLVTSRLDLRTVEKLIFGTNELSFKSKIVRRKE